MNRELPDVQVGFRKGREIRDQIVNICWIIEAREFQKNIYFCFNDFTEAFDCVHHGTLWNIPKEMGVTDPLTCLLRSRHASQEAAVRTGHGTVDRLQIEKAARQGCILSPCLFNLHAQYIMPNARHKMKHKLESSFPGEISITSNTQVTPYGRKQRGTKEPPDEIEKESEKSGLKLNIQKLRS